MLEPTYTLAICQPCAITLANGYDPDLTPPTMGDGIRRWHHDGVTDLHPIEQTHDYSGLICELCGDNHYGPRWSAIAYVQHATYPHHPGSLWGCDGCEQHCYCSSTNTCIHCGGNPNPDPDSGSNPSHTLKR